MDYEFWFWVVFSFVCGVYTGNGRKLFYVGPDQRKFEKSIDWYFNR
jgi:hypothetical protein